MKKMLDGKRGFDDTLKNFNLEFLKITHNSKCERLIDDLDIKTDSLKTDLEKMRDIWLDILEAKKKSSINNEEIERIRKDHENIMTDDYSITIEKLQKRLKMLNNRLPRVEFKPLKQVLKI